jgi:adenosine kinase
LVPQGFFVTVSVDTILAAAELAVQHNKVFMMNLSAPFLIDFFWDGKFEKLLPYVDVLFGNESEAAALAKRLGCSVRHSDHLPRPLWPTRAVPSGP